MTWNVGCFLTQRMRVNCLSSNGLLKVTKESEESSESLLCKFNQQFIFTISQRSVFVHVKFFHSLRNKQKSEMTVQIYITKFMSTMLFLLRNHKKKECNAE